MSAVWMVRAGRGGYVAEDFGKKGCIAIGWQELGDLSGLTSREEVRRLVDEVFSDDKPGHRQTSASQVSRFLLEMEVGNPVLTYDAGARQYLVGEISGPYAYKPGCVEGYPNTRAVTWRERRVSRDDLCVSSKNTLGSSLTLFLVGESVWGEVQRLLEGGKPELPEEEKSEEEIFQEMLGRSHEFVKDRIRGLSWEEMQDFVAGVLRGMGYKTVVSGPGSDRGKDIVASPDGLGLEQPRIRAEVKHRPKQQMGAQDVRSFIGALRANDRGLYVSTGGFTREARYEAERATVPVTLLDMDDLASLLVQVYEDLDIQTRALLPLTRVYWPTT